MTGQEPAPDRLGNYRVLRRLGEGGMGVVYLAADPQDRLVAVKALRQGVSVDPNARYRLAREVETMRRVHSPFVAEVLDADVTSEPPYIVTRYVQGRSLEDVVAESGPLAGEALARLAYGLASALTAVHAAGVVHRDLKPGNVMLADGKPVVIDFGIAQAPDLTRLTMTGMFMGTPGYLAPEVIEGKQSGPAADVHSWGATVAFAATGRPPFGIGSFETIFYRIVHGQPDLDRFPLPLAPLVVDALARDPARRPSAGDLSARLAALDPASLVPGAALPAAAAQAPPGTVMDYRGPAGRAPGAGQVPGAPNGRPAADAAAAAAAAAPVPLGLAGGAPPGPPPAGPAPAGRPPVNGQAPAGPAVAAGQLGWPQVTRPLAAGGPGNGSRGAAAADFRDVLPPVQYAPRGSAPGAAAPASGAVPAGKPGSAAGDTARKAGRTGPLLAAAAVAVAASISVLLPVAGTIAALAALLALRAASLTGSSLARRRSARGSRATDPVLAAVVFPVALLRAVLRMLLLAPLAAVVGCVVAAITIVGTPVHPLPQAGAYAAGAVVLFYGLGPGSAGCRKPLVRFFNALGSTPVSGLIVFIGMAALAIGAIVAALTHPAYYWPFRNPSVQFPLHGLLNDLRVAVLRLVGRRP